MFDVITIGTVTVDTFIKADFLKTVTDKKHLEKIGFATGQAQCLSLGSKIEIKEPIVEIGGDAHNAAVTFARAGLKTAALFNIGDDANGELVVSEIKKKNIQPLEIVDGGKNTGVSYILLSKNGERTILVYRGCGGDIKDFKVPFKKLEARWAYVAPANISHSVLKKIFLRLKKGKTKIALNPSKPMIQGGIEKMRWFLNVASVVILNKEEASFLTHVSYDKTSEIFKKMDKYVSGIVIMTDGKKGAEVSDGITLYKSGVFGEKKVIDRTGAGDAFGSGFVAGLIESEKGKMKNEKTFDRDAIYYALRRAAANATSVIERIGATPGIISKKEFNSSKRWTNLPVKIKRI